MLATQINKIIIQLFWRGNQAASLNHNNENDRVIIHIEPGIYRQQLQIQTPCIIFVSDEPSNCEVLLTWHYGKGYKYYNVDSKGYYDVNSAQLNHLKTLKVIVVVELPFFKQVSYFKAKDINFENSFNLR